MNKYGRMRQWLLAGVIVCCLAWFAGPAAGKTNYVSTPGTCTPASPYNTWTNAFTDLVFAVQYPTNGDTLLVTNGTYYVTNQVLVTNGITILSVGGATNTTVTPATGITNRILIP